MIPPVLLSSLVQSNVLKIIIKPPFMAVPASTKNNITWLGLKQPRTHRGTFRSQFFAIIDNNDSVNKVLRIKVPDMRTLNIPGLLSMQLFMLELKYSDILTAQYFQPESAMPPEVVITNLNRFRQIGNAAKFTDTVFIPSKPVILA